VAQAERAPIIAGYGKSFLAPATASRLSGRRAYPVKPIPHRSSRISRSSSWALAGRKDRAKGSGICGLYLAKSTIRWRRT